MTKWAMGYTCEDCSFFEFEWIELGQYQKGKCINQNSDHFAHFLTPGHPKCDVFEKKRRENENEV
jgi:hypothetical protein